MFFILFCFCLFTLWSYNRAKILGVPWFRMGKQRRKPTPIQYNRLRTRNRHPQWRQKTRLQPEPAVEAIDKSPDYYERLHAFTHSDAFSRRMVMWMSQRHPGKDKRWCMEKIIEDMERNPHLRTDHMRTKTVRVNISVPTLEPIEEWHHLFKREVMAMEPAALRRLDELTHNREVSIRLVERIADKNPMRSAHWCVEKAIFDLERDRMS